MISNSIYLNDADLERLKKLDSLVEELEFRLVAADTKKTAPVFPSGGVVPPSPTEARKKI